MEMTEIQIRAKILTTGRALERADWPNMSAMAARKFCELHARMGGCQDPIDLEKIVMGAMQFVLDGGSVDHPGEWLDQEEIAAETRRPLQYEELNQSQRTQVAAMFPATAIRGALDQYVYDVMESGDVLSRKSIAQIEREIISRCGRKS